ncbi:MAG: zinc-ribbon domain-containing protein [Candidatus Competibacteraceae bacterium]|nr:zinc-ribbon domain-containing protein [Candidatus Competibacteraceae bacterium]MCB1769938.1 zinc-ribbon domain-containing protein [Candidatus Competibacteraceae bacterium]MCB1820126.1 zinc-ribbon domain-containing protein [Candidatus Competibacteraceae bacterium]
MARVRLCPTCGRENAVAVIRCAQCGVSIAHISPTEAAPLIGESPTAHAACPHCEATLPPDSTACPYCGESLHATHIVILWPWGEQPLDQELIVGRDPAVSPLADRLAGYGNLSRRHVRLQPAAEGLWIEDLGATNGVLVNERRLTPHQPFLLVESGTLRLAKDFVATVQM